MLSAYGMIFGRWDRQWPLVYAGYVFHIVDPICERFVLCFSCCYWSTHTLHDYNPVIVTVPVKLLLIILYVPRGNAILLKQTGAQQNRLHTLTFCPNNVSYNRDKCDFTLSEAITQDTCICYDKTYKMFQLAVAQLPNTFTIRLPWKDKVCVLLPYYQTTWFQGPLLLT